MANSTVTDCLHDAIIRYVKNKVQEENSEVVQLLESVLPIVTAPAQSVDLLDLVSQYIADSQNKRFETFIDHLKRKDFFKGHEEGSEEYKTRLGRARKMFEQKFGLKAGDEKKEEEKFSEEDNLSEEEKKAKAESRKEKGNEHLAARRYLEAIREYSSAIRLDSTNAIYYSNRALAYQRLNRHVEAIKDAAESIKLDPNYVKAYARLAHSLTERGELERAIETLNQGLTLNPGNADLIQTRTRIEARAAAAAGGGGGGADGMGGMPGFPPMPNMGAGPGGMPNFMEMMMNPEFQRMAQNLVQTNPALMEMANQLMQDPQALANMFQNMPGGMGIPGMPQMPQMDGEAAPAPSARPSSDTL